MPKSVNIIRLTEAETGTITNATNGDHVKSAIKTLSVRLNDNNRSIRELKNGPLSREQFEAAEKAVTDNLAFVHILPESADRDALSAGLTKALTIIKEGLQMHAEAAPAEQTAPESSESAA